MIQIDFPYTKSKACNDAIAEAGMLGSVREYKKDKRIHIKIKVDQKKMKFALPFLNVLRRLRKADISFDGTPTTFETAFGWLHCYEGRLKSKHPTDYCFGLESEGNANIFGCRYTALVEYGKMGEWDENKLKWLFNKPQIKRKLKNETFKCSNCPAYNAERMDAVVNALPTSVTLRGSKEWAFVTPLVIFPRSGVQKVESPFKNGTGVSFVQGIEMINEAPIDRISKKIGYQIPYDTVYQQIIHCDFRD